MCCFLWLLFIASLFVVNRFSVIKIFERKKLFWEKRRKNLVSKKLPADAGSVFKVSKLLVANFPSIILISAFLGLNCLASYSSHTCNFQNCNVSMTMAIFIKIIKKSEILIELKIRPKFEKIVSANWIDRILLIHNIMQFLQIAIFIILGFQWLLDYSKKTIVIVTSS